MANVDPAGTSSSESRLHGADAAYQAQVVRKADLCAAALMEARRMSGAAMTGAIYAQLLSRARELLDELDEMMLAVDHRATSQRVLALHAGYEELEARRDYLGT